MKPIVIENFLNKELLNKFLDYRDDDYNIDKINYKTGHHFIKYNENKLDYNKNSKTENLINYIINFIKLMGDNINELKLEEIVCIEYWNKHLIKKEDLDILFFHLDVDEQNLLVHNKSELSIVYYFKKEYENGLLLINKLNNNIDQNILLKCREEIINDKNITDNYIIIEPKFNKLVLFKGGEYYHGISKINTSRDSLVLNLWKINPLTKKSLIYNENNIYIINKIMTEEEIYLIKNYMDKNCIDNIPLSRIDENIDKIIFNRLMRSFKYLSLELKNNLPGNNDTGYILLKTKDLYNNKLLQYDNRYFYIEIVLEDIEYEFKYYKRLNVKRNSIILLPYSWNYEFKIESNNFRYTIITNIK